MAPGCQCSGTDSAATVAGRKEASALRGLLGWARDQELLDVVPTVELPHRGAGTRQHTRQPVPLSPSEVAAILAQLPETALSGAGGWYQSLLKRGILTKSKGENGR